MSASHSFCSRRGGLRTCRQIQLSRDGGRELRIKNKKKTIEISNSGAEERRRARDEMQKCLSLWGNVGRGAGDEEGLGGGAGLD